MQARGKHPNSTKKSRLRRNSSATLLCVILIKHKLQQLLLSYVQLCESAQVWVGQRLHICLRHSFMITGTMHLSFSCTPSVLQQNITGKTSYPLRPQLSVGRKRVCFRPRCGTHDERLHPQWLPLYLNALLTVWALSKQPLLVRFHTICNTRSWKILIQYMAHLAGVWMCVRKLTVADLYAAQSTQQVHLHPWPKYFGPIRPSTNIH